MELDRKYKKKIGNLGEGFAEEFLLKNNYKILGKNIVVWGGELDLLVEKNGFIYVVEVKTSKSQINPLEHINLKKLQTVYKTAEYYLRFKLKTKEVLLLAVCAVYLNSDETLKNIEFFENIELLDT